MLVEHHLVPTSTRQWLVCVICAPCWWNTTHDCGAAWHQTSFKGGGSRGGGGGVALPPPTPPLGCRFFRGNGKKFSVQS